MTDHGHWRPSRQSDRISAPNTRRSSDPPNTDRHHRAAPSVAVVWSGGVCNGPLDDRRHRTGQLIDHAAAPCAIRATLPILRSRVRVSAAIWLIVGGVVMWIVFGAIGMRIGRRKDSLSWNTSEAYSAMTGRTDPALARSVPTWARLLVTVGMVMVVVGVIMLIVAVVSDDDDDGAGPPRPEQSEWTSQNVNVFRSQFCVEILAVPSTDATCDCVIEATQRLYPDPDDFFDTTTPSGELLTAWRGCGVGPT